MRSKRCFYQNSFGLLTEHLCDAGVELCGSYTDMDTEKLTELWLTFCVNNNFDINPTVNNLNKMEHAILMKDYTSSRTVKKIKRERNTTGKQHSENDDVLSMYGYAEAGPSKVSFLPCISLYYKNSNNKPGGRSSLENPMCPLCLLENVKIRIYRM